MLASISLASLRTPTRALVPGYYDLGVVLDEFSSAHFQPSNPTCGRGRPHPRRVTHIGTNNMTLSAATCCGGVDGTSVLKLSVSAKGLTHEVFSIYRVTPSRFHRPGLTYLMDIRDLLVRHEKLVHLNEGSNKDGNRPRKSSGESVVHNPQQSPPQPVADEARAAQDLMSLPLQHQQQTPQYPREQMPSIEGMSVEHRMPSRPVACNLDLLSDAATQLASANEMASIAPMVTDMNHQRMKNYDDVVYGGRTRDHEPPTVGFQGHPGPTPPEDFNLFLDEFSTSAHFLPPGFEGEQSVSSWLQKGGPSKPASQMPTRFSSLAPDPRDMQEGLRMSEEAGKAQFQRLSAADHNTLKNRLDEFSSVLPSDFIFPSRHTLTRFVEGYVSGFHDHLPILHLSTLSAVDMSPELLLAILAVGAQYRFESHRSNALWYAAKAVALEQIRRRRSKEVTGLLPTPAAYSPHSTRPSPSHGFRHSFSSVQQERPMTQDTHREP